MWATYGSITIISLIYKTANKMNWKRIDGSLKLFKLELNINCDRYNNGLQISTNVVVNAHTNLYHFIKLNTSRKSFCFTIKRATKRIAFIYYTIRAKIMSAWKSFKGNTREKKRE